MTIGKGPKEEDPKKSQGWENDTRGEEKTPGSSEKNEVFYNSMEYPDMENYMVVSEHSEK